MITLATEPRDGSWPFEEPQAEPAAPKSQPDPARLEPAPVAPVWQIDVTPLLLAIPLLFGAAVLAQWRGGLLRGRIRALVRRRAQTA